MRVICFLVSRKLRGTSTESVEPWVARHLASCHRCADQAAALAELRAAVCDAVPETECRVSWDDVRARIAAGGRMQAPVPSMRRVTVSIAAACAVFVVAGAIMMARLPGSPRKPAERSQVRVVQPKRELTPKVVDVEIAKVEDAGRRPVEKGLRPRARRIGVRQQRRIAVNHRRSPTVAVPARKKVDPRPEAQVAAIPPEPARISADTLGDRAAKAAADALFSLSERMTAEKAAATQQKVADTLATAMPGS